MKSQKKWLIGIIVLLVLMNMTILAFFWLGKRPPGPKKITNHFVKELNLSADQAATFGTLFEAHQVDSRGIMDSIRIYKEKMLETLVQPEKDVAELERLIQNIGVLESEKDKALVQHFIALENACVSEEQRGRLREIFKKSLPKHRHRQK
jgi:uncharacterized membrane protein